MPLHHLLFKPINELTEVHPALPKPSDTSKVGAHRGSMVQRRENTLEAFDLAILQGADVVEFDVRRTLDDVLVIHHDARVKGHLIREVTFDALRASQYGAHLPRLDELLDLVEGRVMLDVELKEGGYEEVVLAMVQAKFSPTQFVITSFQDDVLMRVKELSPEVCTGLLVGHPHYKNLLKTRMDDFFPLVRLKRCKADFLACSYVLADIGVIQQVGAFGFPVVVWSVNDTGRLKRYLKNGHVSVVLSDTPDIAHEQRQAIG